MKITHTTAQYFTAKSAPGTGLRSNAASSAPVAAEPAPSTTTAIAANAAARPAKANDAGQKTAPPGLERVLARLQDSAEPARNAGQAKRLDMISRNIARYVEAQAIGEAPAPTPASPTPVVPTDLAVDSTPPATAANDADAASIPPVAVTGTEDAPAADAPVAAGEPAPEPITTAA